ncbi:MAG TPA: amidase family protein [Acidimicrobiales bacterium]|jgi:aspartyl-tRNA(Asn)/glutamyl-tRNA(Gln) amidotransferase subunit A|nr:amidase family protein [Acidimicrobiales bacterium]
MTAADPAVAPPSPVDTDQPTASTSFAEALALVARCRPSGPQATQEPAVDYHPARAPWASPGAADPVTPPEGGIAATRRRLGEGEVSAVELLQQAIAAAEDRGRALGAIVELLADQATADAVRLDRLAAERGPEGLGPLHGIPVTVKDILHVAGVATRGGSAAYRSVPTKDAVAVARVRGAGAVIVAKVSTHEFALGVTTPQSGNPLDDSRIAGGSSGGSAIAVACGIGMASIGTDTRASIRVPASMCGVVGLKGTYGVVPTGGILPLSWTMDHVAPIAARVDDAALMLAVMADRADLWPPRAATGRHWRIGVPDAGFDGCDPAIATVVGDAIAALAGRLGAAVVALSRPGTADFDVANAAGLIVSRCEAATVHRALGTDTRRCSDEVAAQLAAAAQVSAADYLDAQRLRAVLARDLLGVFDTCDVLCQPTVLVSPPRRTEYDRYLTVLSRPCVPWSLCGFPAVSLPCGRDALGFPVGLQIVGPPGSDEAVIAVAAAAEATVARG